MVIGLLIGVPSGVFIGMVIMGLCAESSRNSRAEEIIENNGNIKNTN